MLLVVVLYDSVSAKKEAYATSSQDVLTRTQASTHTHTHTHTHTLKHYDTETLTRTHTDWTHERGTHRVLTGYSQGTHRVHTEGLSTHRYRSPPVPITFFEQPEVETIDPCVPAIAGGQVRPIPAAVGVRRQYPVSTLRVPPTHGYSERRIRPFPRQSEHPVSTLRVPCEYPVSTL